MCQSDLIPLFSCFCHIVIVLVFKTLNSTVEFQLVFSLNREDLIFQFANQSPVIILSVLVILQLLLVALSQEVDLIIFLGQCSVEVVDLLHEGVFDELSQASHVGDSVFGFGDEVSSGFASSILTRAVRLTDLISETADQLFEAIDFGVLFLFDVFQLSSQGGLDDLLHSDGSFQFVDFPLETLGCFTIFLFEGLELLGKGFFKSLPFFLTLAGGFGSQFFFLLPEVFPITLL